MVFDYPDSARSSSQIPAIAVELLRAESLPVLGRVDECLDHLSLLKVAPKLIELGKPELIAGIARVGRVCRVAPEVSEVLHQHERRVELSEIFVVSEQAP